LSFMARFRLNITLQSVRRYHENRSSQRIAYIFLIYKRINNAPTGQRDAEITLLPGDASSLQEGNCVYHIRLGVPRFTCSCRPFSSGYGKSGQTATHLQRLRPGQPSPIHLDRAILYSPAIHVVPRDLATIQTDRYYRKISSRKPSAW